jgi:hypothetical protein
MTRLMPKLGTVDEIGFRAGDVIVDAAWHLIVR